MPQYEDGEIIGLDHDGCILQWDGDEGETYNCGETPEQFGLEYMTTAERKRISAVQHDEEIR